MNSGRPLVIWYEERLASGQLREDVHQRAAVSLLQQFANESGGRRTFWGRRAKTHGGIYLHGGVGRGKTFLMDGFHLNFPDLRKWRIHFHSFMRHFHQRMQDLSHRHKKEIHRVGVLAADLAKKYRLICFDEFHVSDIADAMILSSLLKELLDRRVRFVMTSNYPPSGLYPNGLARHLFLPAIALLEGNFHVLNLQGDEDYRWMQLGGDALYFHPLSPRTQEAMAASFARLSCGILLPPRVIVQGREIKAVQRSSDAIWFEFSVLCGGAYAPMDYLRLAERFSSIFLSDLPSLDQSRHGEAARRFTWLVDILYDKKINLILSAAVPLNELYGKEEGGEKGRTLSRLREMQSWYYRTARNGPSDEWRSRRDSSLRPPA